MNNVELKDGYYVTTDDFVKETEKLEKKVIELIKEGKSYERKA